MTTEIEQYRIKKHKLDISDVLIWGGIAIVVIWIIAKLIGVI